MEPAGEAVSLVEVQQIVAREVEKVRQELQTQVNNLSTRLAALENTR